MYIGGFGNSLKTTYGYWGTGGAYDTAGGYYGKLWEIKTAKQPGSSPVLLDIKHTWDAGGNLSQREDVVATQTETFGYDFLDRLTSVSGAYTESYAYNQIGNITTKNATAYTYGAKPHAVTAVGPTSYTYDANGNMITRGSDNVTWDVENRPTAVSDNNTYVYDGDGKRVKKTESGQTILYINQYYEKNLTTGEITTYYFSGGMRIAMRKGTTLQYMHQDHLTGTAVMSDSAGTQVGTTMKYYPFGTTRSGSVPTDIKFTGQRLDGTGLYYFNARYYDPVIGRFISADTIVPGAFSAQSLNRYSYVANSPLKHNDPSGHDGISVSGITGISISPGETPSGLAACIATAMASMGFATPGVGLGSAAAFSTSTSVNSGVSIGLNGSFLHEVNSIDKCGRLETWKEGALSCRTALINDKEFFRYEAVWTVEKGSFMGLPLRDLVIDQYSHQLREITRDAAYLGPGHTSYPQHPEGIYVSANAGYSAFATAHECGHVIQWNTIPNFQQLYQNNPAFNRACESQANVYAASIVNAADVPPNLDYDDPYPENYIDR